MSGGSLTEFLLARIAEDERWARMEWESEKASPTSWLHHVIATCEAHRRIISEAREVIAARDGTTVFAVAEVHASRTLRNLAAAYADHLDYRQEWKP